MLLTGDIYFPRNDPEQKLIKSIWYAAGDFAVGQREHIMPSGVAELIFNFSAPISIYRAGKCVSTDLPRCFINGVNVSDFSAVKKTRQHFLGMQLYPYALKALFSIPASEFTDGVIDLCLIDAGINELWHRLGESTQFHCRVNMLLEWFSTRLNEQRQSIDINRCMALYNHPLERRGNTRQIASYYNLSERSLRRKCNDWIGLSTEALFLYQKYLRSLALLHTHPRSLTEIGHLSGYYDQSHFIREFKSFTSLTPGEYQAQKSIVPGHIYLPL